LVFSLSALDYLGFGLPPPNPRGATSCTRPRRTGTRGGSSAPRSAASSAPWS
jgi:hypothetical protein